MAEERKRVFTWEEKKLALKRQLSPYAHAIAILTILEMLLALANGVIPYITGKFVDSLVAPHMTSVLVLGHVPLWEALIGAWLALQVFSNGISFVADRRTRLMTTEMEAPLLARRLSCPTLLRARRPRRCALITRARSAMRAHALLIAPLPFVCARRRGRNA